MPPDARNAPSGDQARARTQPPCPPSTAEGPEVPRSQSRTVVSPDPDARRAPSGEKATASTASVWPGRVAAHRETGRTRKGACGRQTTGVGPSTDAADAARWEPRLAGLAGVDTSGEPATLNAYGRVGLSSSSGDAPFTELTRASSWGGVTVDGTSRVGPARVFFFFFFFLEEVEEDGRAARRPHVLASRGAKNKKSAHATTINLPMATPSSSTSWMMMLVAASGAGVVAAAALPAVRADLAGRACGGGGGCSHASAAAPPPAGGAGPGCVMVVWDEELTVRVASEKVNE
jgi:hypothetical protein